MTYIIRWRNKNKTLHVLKGFDKNKPVWITDAQYRKGVPFYEFGTMADAQYYVKKVQKYGNYRGLSIVEIH